MDLGFWILDFGFWILDFGFWISLVFVLFVAAPNGAVWILEFGVWILEFGVWILDFGVWILDFGVWILDFGLDEALPDIVWILHKIFPCHADSGRRIILNIEVYIIASLIMFFIVLFCRAIVGHFMSFAFGW